MIPAWTAPLRRNAAILATLAVAAVLLFWGLGRPLFWSDEAITAIYSRNTLRFGWPCAWDGRNLCSFGDGTSVSSRDLGAWGYPLLQFYVTAASFAAFGVSTWAGRFPHALLGLASVWFTFLVARRMAASRRDATLAALLLACSPQFLHFSRNCRYFSLTIFLALLWAWLYLRLPPRTWRQWFRPGWTAATLCAATVLFFHAHFLVAGAFCVAAAAAILLVDRGGGRLPLLVPAGALAAVLCAAWWIGVVQADSTSAETQTGPLRDAAMRLWLYLRDMNFTGILPAALAPLAAAALLWRRLSPQAARAVKWIAVLCAAHVLLLALASGEPMLQYIIDANIRYAAPLAPFAAIAAALTLAALAGPRPWLRAALAATWIGTNLFSLGAPLRPPAPPAFRSFLAEFATETFRLAPIPSNSTEAAIEELRLAARQDDIVFVWPEYRRDAPLFYLGDRLLFCGALPANDQRIVPRAATFGLPAYVWSPSVRPDFILGFGFPPRGSRKEIYTHATSLPEFKAVKPRVLYVWYDELSRPELTRRNPFPPPVTPKRHADGVFVIERSR